MNISKTLKIGAIVLSGIILAFGAGYVIFSYFSRIDKPTDVATTQPSQNNSVTVPEDDSNGISSNGNVAGAATSDDSSGISDTPNPNGSIDMRNMEKGGVLGETTTQNGIVPDSATPQRVIITPTEKKKVSSRVTHYETIDDGNDDSEVYIYKYPEVEEEDDYVQYTYTFEFNSDARDRYQEGFTYKIDGDTCDDSDYFTSSKYDLSGTVDSDDMGKRVEIKVRIKDQYIDDENDFDESTYKLDGENYTVRGDIKVPHCEN